MFPLDFLPPWLNTFAFVMLVALGIVLLFVAMLSLRNPLIGKLGVRNIPRRPTQTALIVGGLTLSTVIIISALATGDTLTYSIQRHAVNAYGEIDEMILPPIFTYLAGLEGDGENPFTAADGTTETGDDAVSTLLAGTQYELIFNILRQGLPGISNERYQQLQAQAQDEPLIDGVAPAIAFPTIIRNTRSGQGVPLGFIFAVDSAYDEQFGLHNVAGDPVQMEALNPGVGNVFQSATDLFRMASQAATNAGFSLDLNTAAVAIAAVGALASGSFSEAEANLFLTELLGPDAPQLPAGSLAQLQGLGQVLGIGDLGIGDPAAEGAPNTQSPIPNTQSPDPQSPIPSLQALNLPDATDLLGSLNLNLLRGEMDRVLGIVGLQLRQGDVYLSRLGAEQLDARTGDLLEIFIGPIPLPYRVAGIVEEAGPLAALSPVVMMELGEAQRILSPIMPDRVNAVLVSNLGDAFEGIQHTREVSDRLRILALEPEGVEQVAEILSRPPVLRVVEREAATENNMMPSEIEGMIVSFLGDGFTNLIGSTMPNAAQLASLPDVLRSDDLDALRPILGNIGNRTWLMALPLDAATSSELTAAVSQMTQMEVIDPLNKQSVVSISGVAGSLFSTIFSIFGIFSIMAGVLLIFMIFVMLAAERRSEMGMARAIGMQRGHLVQMFVTEGMLYDLAAALVGVVLGLGVSYAMIGFLGGIFNSVSSQFSGRDLFFQFHWNVSTASIIIAYCAGVIFTFIIVAFSSFRVSRLNIVAAIRDLPDADNGAPRSLVQKILRGVLGPVLLAASGYILWRYNGQGLTVILIGATLAVIGVAFVLSWLMVLRGMRTETRRRYVYTLIGLGMVIAWGVPWASVLGESASLLTGNPAWLPLAFALSAPMIILGSIMIVMFNADTWVWAVNRLLGGIGSLTPVLRTAIAYPLSNRFRTGMAMTLFAMIITTVVVMSIVIQATQTLVTPSEENTAGFHIQMNTTLLSFFDPVTDLAAEIPVRAPETVEDIAQVGRYGLEFVELREPSDPYWFRKTVSGMNAGFITQMSQVYALRMRAEGFADNAAVWQALEGRDDVAVVTSNLLRSHYTFQEDEQTTVQIGGATIEIDEEMNETEGPRSRGDRARGPFWLANVDENRNILPADTVIEIRNDAGEVRALQVIGILDVGSTLASSDILVNEALFTALGIEPGDASWFVAVKEGVDVRETARALEAAFLSSGLDATVMADSFAQGQQITRGILQLFQGFMALGLLVGIAALGVISSRTVVERRQQVGMLRAIGYQPGMVALSFVLESSFIALVGIGIGTAAGVILGRTMLGEFFDLINPGAFVLPWLEIGGILLLAYVFSLLTTILPAIQASRIYPAEALRYE
ncbi:MAG: FtsX-like permease family protein [Caldilineaceae bacterium]|nr:FtsX-like permease family protein [Caldilineaceae bacterium]